MMPLEELMTTLAVVSGTTVSASIFAMKATGFRELVLRGIFTSTMEGSGVDAVMPGKAAAMARVDGGGRDEIGIAQHHGHDLVGHEGRDHVLLHHRPAGNAADGPHARWIRGAHDAPLRDGVGLPVRGEQCGLQQHAAVEVARVADARDRGVDAVADLRQRGQLGTHHDDRAVLRPHVRGAHVDPERRDEARQRSLAAARRPGSRPCRRGP